jgi:hypothetical protein
VRIFHADGFCDGEILATNTTYGQGLPEVDLECAKCGQHVGLLPDVITPDLGVATEQGELFDGTTDSDNSGSDTLLSERGL